MTQCQGQGVYMKNLLSIGEVSKIKGISSRMLRYYDKLGILIPVFINSDTGYRYYSKNQMVILDLIFICTDMGIPLSKFNDFILNNGLYNIEDLTLMGEKIAIKKAKQANDNLERIISLKKIIQRENIVYNDPTTTFFNKRYFFCEKFHMDNFSFEKYWESLSIIYNKIIEFDLSYTINQGQCIIFDESGSNTYSFVEILKPSKITKNILTIPNGNYICENFQDEDIEVAKSKYYKKHPTGSVVIVTDIIEKYLDNEISPFQVQLFIP